MWGRLVLAFEARLIIIDAESSQYGAARKEPGVTEKFGTGFTRQGRTDRAYSGFGHHSHFGKRLRAASISDIVKAAGISIGTMYHYFSSKDEIFADVLKRGQLDYGKRAAEPADEQTMPPLLNLHEFAAGWLANPINWAYTIMLQSARTTETVPAEIRQAVTDRFTANLKPIARIMEDGQVRGEIMAGDALQLAFYYVSSCHVPFPFAGNDF